MDITTPVTDLTERAHQAANQFAGEQAYEGFGDILADLLAGARLLADQMQLNWPSVQQAAKAAYLAHVKASKPARAPRAKTIREPIPAAAQYRVEIQPPDGGAAIVEASSVAYLFAVLQKVDGAWGIRSRVNSKAVAASRCHTFRKGGVPAASLKIVEVFPQPMGDAPAVAPAAKPVVKRGRRQAEQPAVEIEREPVAAELTGQNLEFPGSDKVHAPNGEYMGALCGAGKSKDPRQTEREVTCRNCQRLITLYTLVIQATAEQPAVE
ncbi:MAG: hypothetical protein IPP13_22440 [Kouleothrix sp.]|nr:hypothetical protein [Kouleothrix sp.]